MAEARTPATRPVSATPQSLDVRDLQAMSFSAIEPLSQLAYQDGGGIKQSSWAVITMSNRLSQKPSAGPSLWWSEAPSSCRRCSTADWRACVLRRRCRSACLQAARSCCQALVGQPHALGSIRDRNLRLPIPAWSGNLSMKQVLQEASRSDRALNLYLRWPEAFLPCCPRCGQLIVRRSKIRRSSMKVAGSRRARVCLSAEPKLVPDRAPDGRSCGVAWEHDMSSTRSARPG